MTAERFAAVGVRRYVLGADVYAWGIGCGLCGDRANAYLVGAGVRLCLDCAWDEYHHHKETPL